MPVPVNELERQLGRPSLRRISPYNPEPGLSKRGSASWSGRSPPLESSSDAVSSASTWISSRSWMARRLRSWNTKSSARMVTPKNRISRMLTQTSSRVLNERGCIVLADQFLLSFTHGYFATSKLQSTQHFNQLNTINLQGSR